MTVDRSPSGGVHDRPAASSDRWWLNRATVRGAALVVAGTVVLVTPDNRRALLSVVGGLLVVWAATVLWFSLVRRRTPAEPPVVEPAAPHHRSTWVLRVVIGIGLLVGAVLLFLDNVRLTLVIGAAIAVRGLWTAWTAWHRGGSQQRSGFAVAALQVVLGAVCVVVPDTAVLALRAGLGIGSMALGGVLLSVGLRRGSEAARERFDHTSAPVLLNEWLMHRRLGPELRGQLVDSLFFEPPNRSGKLASFWVMMVLATSIASFALIQDSTAVVIGAMLVAPLMTPIMGVAAAAVNGWGARLARSLVLVAVAAAAAIAVAWLISSWLPSVGQIATNSQITSRVEPALLDFCIAVAAGAAGAYATVDPRVSSSLSGVAIAVALVPPLSVVGITLQQGMYEWSLGALLLFLTNFVSIVLSATLVFVLTGFALLPPDQTQRERLRRVLAVFGAGALLILVPLSLTSQEVWTEASDRADAEEVIDAWLPAGDDLQLVEVTTEGDRIDAVLTGPELPSDTSRLKQELTERLGFVPRLHLRLVTSELVEVN